MPVCVDCVCDMSTDVYTQLDLVYTSQVDVSIIGLLFRAYIRITERKVDDGIRRNASCIHEPIFCMGNQINSINC